jgi:nitric oxide dioxygenase
MLSAETISIIKATVPALQAHGETLTRHFYRRMFNGNPEVRAFFNPAHQHSGSQQRALAAAICAYAEHIENPAVLGAAVELIAQKHASLDVKPEHYPIVGEHLLASIREVLGAAATDAVIDAWAQAYGVLADILIKRERQIYAEHCERHGWSGFKPFVVRRKVRESATITSFYLAPADGSPLQPFQPGQYVTVRVPGTWHATTLRNYSLSGKPGEPYYRISVKREPAPSASVVAPAGHVSNYLHDAVVEGTRIDLAPPCGEFVLVPSVDARRPLVFLSGGVGVTPVLAMLHAALARGEDRDVWFIHGALDGESHAFAEEVRALAAAHPRLRVHVRYDRATAVDLQLGRCDGEGLIDLSLLKSLLEGPDAEFYFCGPKPMMAGLFQGLQAWGVAPQRLHYEFFGPAQELRGEAKPAAQAECDRHPGRPCCKDAACARAAGAASVVAS